MIWAILRYIPKALFAWAATFVAWALCWFIALFHYQQDEHRVTGYPSQFPGKLRDHLAFPFTWAGTFDDCADAFFYSGRMVLFKIFGWAPFSHLTTETYEASPWFRYCSRVLWLCRNPCYTLKRDLGYSQYGLMFTHPGRFINQYNQRGFLTEGEWPVPLLPIKVEWVLGYKVPWEDERKNMAMLANRVVLRRK